PQKGMIDLAKNSLRRNTPSYRLVKEQETAYNGKPGWQIETEGSLAGHDTYFVQWIVATNGVGYQLTGWAPAIAKTELEDEAQKLFADFELTTPESASAAFSDR